MNIFTADTTSLKIIRLIRRGAGLRLARTDVTQADDYDVAYMQLHKLGIGRLCNVLNIGETDPLCVIVTKARARKRCKGLRCVIRRHPRCKHPFLEVVPANANCPNTLIPTDGRLYVEAPESIVVSMASRLSKYVRQKKYSEERAVLMLLKLCLELCGTYSHDPLDPWNGEVTYGTEPVMSAESLKEVVEGLSKVPGLPLARKVLSLVYNNSGSPEESFMGHALFGSSAYGGLDLGAFEANKALDISAEQLRVITERRIRPDLSMEAYKLAIEFKGKKHEQGDNPQKDRVRSLDYQTLGWREFAFWYSDVRTRGLFNASASRIVAALENYEGPTVRRRFERLISDPSFSELQDTVLEVFRPWLRDGANECKSV